MSVYSRGDRKDDDEPPKKESQSIEKKIDQAFGDAKKGFDNLFGTKKNKWKKTEGNRLGTAEENDAMREKRLQAMGGSSSSSSAPAPQARTSRPPPQPTRAPTDPGSPSRHAPPAVKKASSMGSSTTPSAVAPPPAPSGGFNAQQPLFNSMNAPRQMEDVREAERRELTRDYQSEIPQAAVAQQPPVPEEMGAGSVWAECLYHLRDIGAEQSLASMEIMCKVLTNISSNPTEAKFRKLRLGNNKIQQTIGQHEAAMQYLQLVGFVKQMEAEEEVLVCPSEVDVEWLSMAIKELNLAITAIKSQSLGVKKPTAQPLQIAPVARESSGQPTSRDIKVYEPGPSGNVNIPWESEATYNLSAAEASALVQSNKAALAAEERLMTREMRERERLKKQKQYSQALLRVRFPDGTVLQGRFGTSEKIGAILQFVSESLREPWRPFHLQNSISRKKLEQMGTTIQEEQLAPATLLNLLWDETLAAEMGTPPAQAPFLAAELMAKVQHMQEVQLPQGTALIPEAPSTTNAPSSSNNNRQQPNQAPSWFKAQ